MLTAFDVGVGVLVLISAILATARGFTREVLSLATWAGSAAIAAYMYFYHKDIARGFIQGDLVPDAVTVIGSFLVSLIILHLITMWIADLVVDSKVGPLDRTLGFLFGVARGVLIAVVVTVFGVWLLGAQLPTWAAQSKSLPVLQGWGNSLIALLPDDLEKQLTDIIQKGSGGDDTGEQTDVTPGQEGAAPDAATSSAPATNT
jgi:membrane protein required for colicin V production